MTNASPADPIIEHLVRWAMSGENIRAILLT